MLRVTNRKPIVSAPPDLSNGLTYPATSVLPQRGFSSDGSQPFGDIGLRGDTTTVPYPYRGVNFRVLTSADEVSRGNTPRTTSRTFFDFTNNRFEDFTVRSVRGGTTEWFTPQAGLLLWRPAPTIKSLSIEGPLVQPAAYQQQFKAKAVLTDGTVLDDVTELVEWQIGPTEVEYPISNRPGTSGLVTARLSKRAYTVKASYLGVKDATQTGSTPEFTDPRVVSILVTPVRIKAEAYPFTRVYAARSVLANGKMLEPANNKFEWTTSDPTRVTVTPNGEATVTAANRPAQRTIVKIFASQGKGKDKITGVAILLLET